MGLRILMMTRTTAAHGPGGFGDHVKALTGGLIASGHEVTVLTTRTRALEGLHRTDGCETYFLARTRPGAYDGGWWSESRDVFGRLVRERSFDVVHSQSAAARSVVLSGLARDAGIPVVASFHGTSVDEILTQLRVARHHPRPRVLAESGLLLARELGHWLVRDLPFGRRLDGAIATSDEQVATIARGLRVPRERIHVVYNGIDTAVFKPEPDGGRAIRKRYEIPEEVPLITAVAALTLQKGVRFLVRAMPRILARVPDARLLLVGDGPDRTAIEREARTLGVEANLRFAGHRPLGELPAHLGAADLFVNATIRQNGYDLTILQAMACGVPPVVTRLGSNMTPVKDGKTGRLVAPGDARALGDAVVGLLRDDPLRRTIGDEARALCVERFSTTRMVADTVRVHGAVKERAQARR